MKGGGGAGAPGMAFLRVPRGWRGKTGCEQEEPHLQNTHGPPPTCSHRRAAQLGQAGDPWEEGQGHWDKVMGSSPLHR